MEMNRSYDETDESDMIIIQKQKKLDRKCKCIDSCINIYVKYTMGVCACLIYILLIYYIVTSVKDKINHDDKGYKYLEKDDTGRRRLVVNHRHICDKYKYGCCSINTGNFVNGTTYNLKEYKFSGIDHIKKHDKYGNNCPNLILIITIHNEKHASENSCLNDPDYRNKCCKFDIMADQMEKHGGIFKHDKKWINHYLKLRYSYLIDYNNGNCPSIQELMNEYRNPNSCNPRYTDCHATDMLIISILSLIVLTCIAIYYLREFYIKECKGRIQEYGEINQSRMRAEV
jgi:hypothetical protein